MRTIGRAQAVGLLVSTLSALAGCPSPGAEAGSEGSSDDVDTSTDGSSTEAPTTSESSDSTSSESSESGAASSESAGSESSESAGAESSESTSAESGSSEDDATDTSTDTGILEPIECPLVDPNALDIVLTGYSLDYLTETFLPLSSEDCTLPEVATMMFSDHYENYVSFYSDSCLLDGEIGFDGEFLLPNNFWLPTFALDFYVCYEFHFYSEPVEPDGCRLARMDIYDPQVPEIPIYSVGSTTTHLDVGGFVLEPVDPIPCEAECMSGEVHSLRFTAGAGQAELAPGEFPWTTFDTGSFELEVIRYDAYALTPSQDPNCPGGEPIEQVAWAAKRP